MKGHRNRTVNALQAEMSIELSAGNPACGNWGLWAALSYHRSRQEAQAEQVLTVALLAPPAFSRQEG